MRTGEFQEDQLTSGVLANAGVLRVLRHLAQQPPRAPLLLGLSSLAGIAELALVRCYILLGPHD